MRTHLTSFPRLSRMASALARWFRRTPRPIPTALWQCTLGEFTFLAALQRGDRVQLHRLASRFLAQKQFSGAHGLVVTDAMAVAVAAQACLPLLHLGGSEASALRLYDDFKGIVLHPGAMLAQRERRDAAGVVHTYREALVGEAMAGGPVTLSWQDVRAAGALAQRGHNVVIHEFIHKIDMKTGHPNGCPPLPSRVAKAHWQHVMQTSFDSFCQQVTMAERFGANAPWLDAYGATHPAEFFAVAAEAYFVNRARFCQDFAALTALFDAFFRPAKAAQPGMSRVKP